MEAAPDSALDSYFLLLEGELRRHLNAFLAAQAQSGTVDVAGIASPDVRLLLQTLAKRWHSPQAATTAQQQTQTQYKKKNLRLEGSSVIATNFLTILTVLNCYHHRSTAPPLPSFAFVFFSFLSFVFFLFFLSGWPLTLMLGFGQARRTGRRSSKATSARYACCEPFATRQTSTPPRVCGSCSCSGKRWNGLAILPLTTSQRCARPHSHHRIHSPLTYLLCSSIF